MKFTKPTLPQKLNSSESPYELFEKEDSITGFKVENITLTSEHLEGTRIAESLFNKVDFVSLTVDKFDVTDCEFRGCNFTASNFPESSWHRVSIVAARCSGMQITDAVLKNITYKNSKIEIVNFRFSRLENVVFEECVINDVDFYEAQLKNVEFVNCTISKITFSGARMMNIDISKSFVEAINGIQSLRGVTISYDQLMQLAPSFAAEAGIKVK